MKVDNTTSKAILDPQIEIQAILSRSVAHRGSLTVGGDQRQVFRELLVRCDKAMRMLAELVRSGTFSLPQPPKQ